MSKRIFFLFSCWGLLFTGVEKAAAQYQYDVKVVNLPVTDPLFYFPPVKGSIKQITMNIVKPDKPGGTLRVADTLRITSYDSLGRETTELWYAMNRPSKLFVNTYDTAGNKISSIHHPLAENEGMYHSYNTYSGGKLVQAKTYYIKAKYRIDEYGDGTAVKQYISPFGDTSKVYLHQYGYDSLGRQNYRKHNGGEQYFYYENTTLVRHDDHVRDFEGNGKLGKDRNGRLYKAGDVRRTVYTYNKHGLLEKQEIFLDTLTGSVLIGWATYEYEDTLMVREKYVRSTGSEADETEVRYEYNRDNRLVKMTSRRGKALLEVKYEYGNGKISRIEATKNSTAHFSEFGFEAPVFGKKDFLYEEHYTYNERGNLTEIAVYMDGEWVTSHQYTVGYY